MQAQDSASALTDWQPELRNIQQPKPKKQDFGKIGLKHYRTTKVM
jgi:hypothetical protein